MSHDEVRRQYEAYPYPERRPEDEKKRLITGSPSLPTEMDHWLWGGARDWRRPLRALFAGGGSGDGLIQLAQLLTDAGRPYEITYVDLSTASRKIAEARVAARGLKGINFVTGSLLEAASHGRFDYIDCCGVLHHLPDPQAGFDALAGALAPGGGLGCMVYAPLGRSGVYPLQEAFRDLLQGLEPHERLARAKTIYKALPGGHPFKRNPHLVDHEQGDAGFYDLLLHSTDRPFTISEVDAALGQAGLELAGVTAPLLYDLAHLLPDPKVIPQDLSAVARMALAEKLRGTCKTHVFYARPKGTVLPPPLGKGTAVPHLMGPAEALARTVAKSGAVTIDADGEAFTFPLPKSAAALIAAIDGRRSLDAIRAGTGLDVIGFSVAWKPVEKALCGMGLLHYSQLLTR
jgi:SAM-dependent methyltransferase